MVIYPVRGTYNHAQIFLQSKLKRQRLDKSSNISDLYVPKFLSSDSVLSEVSIFDGNCQMATCTITANLASVNSFNNTCFEQKVSKSTQTQQFMGKISNTSTIAFGSFPTLLFFVKLYQIPSDDICPVRWTYNHAQTFLWSKIERQRLDQQVEHHLRLLYIPIFVSNYCVLSEISIFVRNMVRW